MTVRIAHDGTVRGLWTDEIDWPALGRVSVRRASHVEFDDRRQLWTVRERGPRCRLRSVAQHFLCRPMGESLFRAHRREEALAWERAYFGPGGVGWDGDSHFRKEGSLIMSLFNAFWGLLAGWRSTQQCVRDHDRRQAFGPRWSRRRNRRIGRYTRRRAKRARGCS